MIDLIGFGVYLLIGGLIAFACVPTLWARAERNLSYFEDRTVVVIAALLRFLLWPVMGPYELLARRIDATDPDEVRRKMQEQKLRIAELERELGIGDSRG